MNNEEMKLIVEGIFQIALITSIFVAISVILIKTAKNVSLWITKKRIALKLKKYELSKYTIYFDNNGLPTTLVEKETNQIKFI